MNFLSKLFTNVNIYDLLLGIYREKGRDGVKRFLTPPENYVRHICKKTGADFDEAIVQRDQAVEETLQFVESLVDNNFDEEEAEIATSKLHDKK